MKIDMHTHSLPVSLCAHHLPEELPQMFLAKGIDAIVLTNHCYPHHTDKLSPDLKEQAMIYIETYHRCKEAGEEIGLKVFFGVEIKLINEVGRPEFLLYGISEEDFTYTYPLYNCTQKELFDFCNQKNIVMVQSHPYRREQGYAPADMRYVHGIEVYNAHPSFDARFEDTLALAEQNNKLKTSGSDFHIEVQAGLAGMLLPDDIKDQFMLRDYLKTKEQIIFDKSGIIYSSSAKQKNV
jgi:predicted metal-dependent phosphoesterase TrpH